MSLLAIDTAAYGLIEMVLVFGLVLVLAIWELVRVRRSLREDRATRADPGKGRRHEDHAPK